VDSVQYQLREDDQPPLSQIQGSLGKQISAPSADLAQRRHAAQTATKPPDSLASLFCGYSDESVHALGIWSKAPNWALCHELT
jgi:hypothetical protein